MYKELVLKLSEGIEWVKVQPPCSDNEISKAELLTIARFISGSMKN